MTLLITLLLKFLKQQQEPVTSGARGPDYRPVPKQIHYAATSKKDQYNSYSNTMDAKLKQQWSEEETKCLLALWSTTEVQNKLDGAVRTKPIFENIQLEMATAGYDRSIEQLINTIKTFKKEYRDQKKDLGRSGSPSKKNPYYDILESVLGDRPACQVRGALNSATAMLEALMDDSGQFHCFR